MAGRRCPGRDERDGRSIACPTILTRGERYCPRHARGYEARRGTSVQRGYGAEHRRLRASWQGRIDAGERVVCATCPTVIAGDAWDLGHTDDRTTWTGPQCLPCNRGDGGRKGAATRSAM